MYMDTSLAAPLCMFIQTTGTHPRPSFTHLEELPKPFPFRLSHNLLTLWRPAERPFSSIAILLRHR